MGRAWVGVSRQRLVAGIPILPRGGRRERAGEGYKGAEKVQAGGIMADGECSYVHVFMCQYKHEVSRALNLKATGFLYQASM